MTTNQELASRLADVEARQILCFSVIRAARRDPDRLISFVGPVSTATQYCEKTASKSPQVSH